MMKAGMEQLQAENRKLKEELELLAGGDRESESEGGARAVGRPASLTRATSLASASLDPVLLAGLQQSVSELERYMAATASLARQVRSCEMDMSVAQATESMRQIARQQQSRQQQLSAAATADEGSYSATYSPDSDGLSSEARGGPSSASMERDVEGGGGSPSEGGGAAGGAPSSSSSQHMSIVGKLQRLEMERRLQAEEISDLGEQLALSKMLADKVGGLREEGLGM